MSPTFPAMPLCRRRALLCSVAASCVAPLAARAQSQSPTRPAAPTDAARAAAASAHFPFGPVVPARPMPAWPLTTHLGQPTTLRALTQGKLTALQLMFTGCSATCPIQGAIFAEAQRQLGTGVSGAQFVSLSIDPLSDTPQALAAWLKNFGAQAGWVAAAPRLNELDALFELLSGPRVGKRSGPDPHTGQVYFLNRRGELVYRSADLPPPAQIVQAMRRVDAAG
jgi:protein SCO1